MSIRPRRPGTSRGEKTSPHSFRTADSVWNKAAHRAKKEGVPMNYVIEQFVIGYANKALNLPKVTITFGQGDGKDA